MIYIVKGQVTELDYKVERALRKYVPDANYYRSLREMEEEFLRFVTEVGITS